MTGERAPAFVDTNLLVYAFGKSSSPKKRIAREAGETHRRLNAGGEVGNAPV